MFSNGELTNLQNHDYWWVWPLTKIVFWLLWLWYSWPIVDFYWWLLAEGGRWPFTLFYDVVPGAVG